MGSYTKNSGKNVKKSITKTTQEKQKNSGDSTDEWNKAVEETRKLLQVTESCPLGGTTPLGQAVLVAVQQFYEENKKSDHDVVSDTRSNASNGDDSDCDNTVARRDASNRARNASASNGLGKWITAVQQARDALGIKGFCPCGGETAKGQALMKMAREFYEE